MPGPEDKSEEVVPAETSQTTQQDHYGILGVARDATLTQINKAFRLKSLEWHPDRNSNKIEAENKIRQINEAVEVLRDPVKRKQYDEDQTKKATFVLENVIPPQARRVYQIIGENVSLETIKKEFTNFYKEKVGDGDPIAKGYEATENKEKTMITLTFPNAEEAKKFIELMKKEGLIAEIKKDPVAGAKKHPPLAIEPPKKS